MYGHKAIKEMKPEANVISAAVVCDSTLRGAK